MGKRLDKKNLDEMKIPCINLTSSSIFQENHTMEPLQKLHWFGILTAFLPFLMFTSAQNINVMRENLSPVFYNPKKTNPLSNQMAQLQRIARQQVCTINF